MLQRDLSCCYPKLLVHQSFFFQLLSLRFGKDLRVQEIRGHLQSSKPVTVSVIQKPEVRLANWNQVFFFYLFVLLMVIKLRHNLDKVLWIPRGQRRVYFLGKRKRKQVTNRGENVDSNCRLWSVKIPACSLAGYWQHISLAETLTLKVTKSSFWWLKEANQRMRNPLEIDLGSATL